MLLAFALEAHRLSSDAFPERDVAAAGPASPEFNLACSSTRRRHTTGRFRLRNTCLAVTTARSLAVSSPPLLTARMVNFSMFWGVETPRGGGVVVGVVYDQLLLVLYLVVVWLLTARRFRDGAPVLSHLDSKNQ